MADPRTFARPYARAAFDYANAHKVVGEWRVFLDRLAELAALAPVHDLVSTPVVSRERRAEVLAEIAGVAVPQGGDNFLRLMARNGRLEALPAVSEEFARLEALAEGTMEAVIETAVELEPAAAKRLAEALGKRLGGTLEASFRVAPEIIGGVVIRIGDQVIDASLATRLSRLARTMAA